MTAVAIIFAILFLIALVGLFTLDYERDELRTKLQKFKVRDEKWEERTRDIQKLKEQHDEELWNVKSEWQRLQLGIQKHMNAKGHDRCWLNDLELYQLIDPQYDKMKMQLPCMPEFLHNCCIYWRDNQPPENRKL